MDQKRSSPGVPASLLCSIEVVLCMMGFVSFGNLGRWTCQDRSKP